MLYLVDHTSLEPGNAMPGMDYNLLVFNFDNHVAPLALAKSCLETLISHTLISHTRLTYTHLLHLISRTSSHALLVLGCLCMAGAAFGAHGLIFAWQV